MRTVIGIGFCSLFLLGGCPEAQQGGSTSAVHVVIGYTAAEGPAPLSVLVTAIDSTSRNGYPLLYEWDFADGTSSTDEEATHTYETPGRYVVTLRVTDPAGKVGVASLEIRVQGGAAVAIIGADKDDGPKPLTVQFDGTQSQVGADTVHDYFWDFGDGVESNEARPRHTFNGDGEFTVTLRIVTGGGVEANTFTTITVGERNASLLFDGHSLATLPLASQRSLTACTFETWVKMDSDGGNVVSVGAGVLSLDLLPASGAGRLRINGTENNTSVGGLAGTWTHVAVVYDAKSGRNAGKGPTSTDPNSTGDTDTTGGSGTSDESGGVCTVYVNAVGVLTVTATQTLSVDRVTIGNGMRGKMGEVRFWGVARTASEITASRSQRLSGGESSLLGLWPLDEGTGQVLGNRVAGGADGTLGSSTAVETSDPAWSPEGPPL